MNYIYLYIKPSHGDWVLAQKGTESLYSVSSFSRFYLFLFLMDLMVLDLLMLV